MISPTQRPLPDNTQHSQQTDIHVPGGIRIHNISRRAAVDPHLRPRGHCDRHKKVIRWRKGNVKLQIFRNDHLFYSRLLDNLVFWKVMLLSRVRVPWHFEETFRLLVQVFKVLTLHGFEPMKMKTKRRQLRRTRCYVTEDWNFSKYLPYLKQSM